MEASSPIPGKAHRCTWAKHAAGSSSSGAPPLPSAASPFAGRAPGTPTSASWPPRRALGRIPSKYLPFSCSFAVPRARKGGLQARQAHQKALALKISAEMRISQSRHLDFCFFAVHSTARVVRAPTELRIRQGSVSVTTRYLATPQ